MRLNKVFKAALHALQLVRRDHDPLTEFIAKQVVEIGQTGVRDPAQISELAVKKIASHRPPCWRHLILASFVQT